MTEKSLDQKILTWLSAQGYGVEMQVAEILVSAGFEILKSAFYEDPETGKSREIDVIGRLTDAWGLVYVHSIIECKKSSKPWIVFTSEKAGYNRIHSFAIMSDFARKAVGDHATNMVNLDWFKKPGRQGYGVTEAFNKNADDTFKAGMTATKAAMSLLDEQEDNHHFNSLSFFFPTVVLDGQLFESFLGEDKKPVVAEIDSAFLMFPIKIGKYTGSVVRVVTLKSFDRYCNDLKSIYDFIKVQFSEEVNELKNQF